MIPWLNSHTLTYLAWGLVNAGLVVQLGQQMQWGAQPRLPIPVVVEKTPDKMDVETMPDYRLPDLNRHFKETLERPLFVPTRSEAPPIPPPPPPPPPPKPRMQKGQFVLMGTVLLDEGNMAILKETDGTRIRQVVEGRLIDGIKLERVQPDRVMLSQYDESEELRLKVLPSAKPVVSNKPTENQGKAAMSPARRVSPKGRTLELDTRSQTANAAPNRPEASPERAPTPPREMIDPSADVPGPQ